MTNEITTQNANANEVTQETQTQFEGIGYDLANDLMKKEGELYATRRQSVIVACKKASAHEKEFLNGFANACTQAGMQANARDSRKSEIKLIFRTVTSATTDDLQKIENEATGWHDFVSKCRAHNQTLISPDEKLKLENKAAIKEKNKQEKIRLENEAKEALLNAPFTDSDINDLILIVEKKANARQCEILYKTLEGMIKTKQAAELKEAARLEKAAKIEADRIAKLAKLQAEMEALQKAA